MGKFIVNASKVVQLRDAGAGQYEGTHITGTDSLELDTTTGTDQGIVEFDLSTRDLSGMTDVEVRVQCAQNSSPNAAMGFHKYTGDVPKDGEMILSALFDSGISTTYVDESTFSFPASVAVDDLYSFVLSDDIKTQLMTDMVVAKAGSGIFPTCMPIHPTGGSGPLQLYTGNAGRASIQLIVTTVSSEDDPFTKVYRALWDMLEESPLFVSLVPEGCRIKLASGTHRLAMKDTFSERDTPEVRIIQSGITPLQETTSCSSMYRQRYEIQVFSGGITYHPKHNPVKWAVLNALHRWRDVLAILTYNGERFVHLSRPVDATEYPTVEREILGWESVWAVEVHMHFRRLGMTA